MKCCCACNRCLTSARPEDLVTSIAAELRPVVDFDLLDIVVNRTSSEVSPMSDCQSQSFTATGGSASNLLPQGEEIKSQCSLPLISRGSKLGFFVVGRFDENDFAEDDIEFLTQVAGQVAMFIDNSMAYRHIAQLTEKLTPRTSTLKMKSSPRPTSRKSSAEVLRCARSCGRSKPLLPPIPRS